MSLQHYRAMLRINRHALDDELEMNAQTMDEIGQQVGIFNSRMIEAKKNLDVTEAQVTQRLKEADPKLTNPGAERECKRDRGYIIAWTAYQNARAEHEEWESLYKAWVSRSYDLKALGELFANQYFAVDSVRGPSPGRVDQEALRASMRERSGGYQRKDATSRRTHVD